MRLCWLVVLAVVSALGACATDGDFVDDPGDASWGADGKADGASSVNVETTHLDVHLADHTAVATIALEKPGSVALEAGGLTITRVSDDRGKRHYRIVDGTLMVANVHGSLVVEYGFSVQHMADGLLPGGSTVIWPYFCGNVFPCHSQPADGETFTLSIDGVPSGKQAIYPSKIEREAPPYMLAWAVGAYTQKDLGTTDAGTHVSVYYLPGGDSAATSGTRHLRDAFDWYEKHIGPYSFGSEVA